MRFLAFFGYIAAAVCFIGSVFGILHRFFVIRRNVIAFIVRRFLLFFLAFLLLFMFFVFGRNREYCYACVSDFYSRFIVQMYVDCYRQHESKYDDEQYIYENKPAHKPSVSVWCADGTPIRVSAGVIGLFLKAVIRNKIGVLL